MARIGRPWRRHRIAVHVRGLTLVRVDGIGRGWSRQWQLWVAGDPHQLGCVQPSARGTTSSSKGNSDS